jgi:hypothetical protein
MAILSPEAKSINSNARIKGTVSKYKIQYVETALYTQHYKLEFLF